MRLDPKERDKMAADNYKKFKNEIKFGQPFTDSRLRQGNGKGDAQRRFDKDKFDENWDKIRWKSKHD
jgi:hypothetical protein